MSQLLSIFLNNLAPIFFIAAAGFTLRHFLRLDPRPLSQVIFYLLSPCLLFNLLTGAKMSGADIARLMSFVVIVVLIVGALALMAGRLLSLERRRLAGFLLVTMFMNAGNYGMPVVLFAFGQEALSYASLYFATNAMLAYILGAVIASSGSVGFGQALKNLVRLPTVYAMLAALLFINTGWEIPVFLGRTTKLLGDASIPCMLILLGMQLHSASWRENPLAIGTASALRLAVGPILTLLLAPWFGFSPAAYRAVVLESGMPSAVLNIMVATEFGADPAFVSAVVLVTTVLSPLTLTPLLYYLGA